MASLHPLSSKIVLNPPQFFKIVLQKNLENKNLMIPNNFTREYGKFLSSSVRLRLPDSMEWEIELSTATNGAVWLHNGWHQFAKHYNLEFGSLLIFRFDGCSTFHTTIFDITGSEIAYYVPRHLNQREKTSFSCQEFYVYRKKRSCRRHVILPTAKKAEEPQRFSNVLKSDQPCFKVTMGKSYVSGRFNMMIPKEFAEKYLVEEFGTIGIQTSDGRNWSLLYKWSRSQARDYAYISDGWKRFVEENMLKEGDVGLFQLIKKGQLLFSKQEICASAPKRKVASTKNPFFEVDVRLGKSPILNIPMEFTKEHLSPEMHTAKLVVRKKQWNVSMKNYERRIRFSAGWPAFCRDNALEDGDTCLFELLKKNHSRCAFKVDIFTKISSSVSVD